MQGRFQDLWRALTGKPTRGEATALEEIAELRSSVDRLVQETHELRELTAIQRSRIDQLEAARVAAPPDRLEALFESVAAHLSQLRLQGHLMEGGREISGRSVMALASHIVEAIENLGLEPMGTPGEQVPFDPATCRPINAGASFQSGQLVVVKFVGYKHKGNIVHKALVDAVADG
jgi:molecular chaperone GrpE (heat shock protein)